MASDASGRDADDRFAFKPPIHLRDNEDLEEIGFLPSAKHYENMSRENLAEEILELMDSIRTTADCKNSRQIDLFFFVFVAGLIYKLHLIRERIGVLLENGKDSALQSASEVLLICSRRLRRSFQKCGGGFSDDIGFYYIAAYSSSKLSEYVFERHGWPVMTLRDLNREYGTQLEGLAAKMLSHKGDTEKTHEESNSEGKPLPRRTEVGEPSFIKAANGYTVKYEGKSVVLTDSKGARILYELISEQGEQIDALELNILVDPPAVPQDTEADGRRLDEKALKGDGLSIEFRKEDPVPNMTDRDVKIVRKHIDDVNERAKILHERGDIEGAEEREEELVQLEKYLSQATDIGGRARRIQGITQQAREKLRAAVNDVLTRHIEIENRALCMHLRSSLEMRAKFSYSPEVHVAWRLM